jgi:hypothetical protein
MPPKTFTQHHVIDKYLHYSHVYIYIYIYIHDNNITCKNVNHLHLHKIYTPYIRLLKIHASVWSFFLGGGERGGRRGGRLPCGLYLAASSRCVCSLARWRHLIEPVPTNALRPSFFTKTAKECFIFRFEY